MWQGYQGLAADRNEPINAVTSATFGYLATQLVWLRGAGVSELPPDLLNDEFMELFHQGADPKKVPLRRIVNLGGVVEHVKPLLCRQGAYRGLESIASAVVKQHGESFKLTGVDLLRVERNAMAALLAPPIIREVDRVLGGHPNPANVFYGRLAEDEREKQGPVPWFFPITREARSEYLNAKMTTSSGIHPVDAVGALLQGSFPPRGSSHSRDSEANGGRSCSAGPSQCWMRTFEKLCV